LQLPLGLGATQAQRALEILAEVPQVLSSN
jgi:hypothetical protein